MPDIFLSYSRSDREVAERIQARLTSEGYDVFWDQNTPPGTDWDTWIRDRLKESRCVLVLWSRSSVVSPNVRHEAIIGRERAKLLPVMVDDLNPDDFPMGLFLVQAVKVGRTRKSLAAAWPKLLEEVRAKLAAQPPDLNNAKSVRPRTRARRPLLIWLSAAVAALILGFLFLPSMRPILDPDFPPVPPAAVEAARSGEALAGERVVRSAEEALTSGRRAVGTSYAWLAGQLISAAPEQARGIAPEFFRYLPTVESPECGCYITEDVPHAVGNAWVAIAFSRYRRPLPERFVRTILTSQSREGWWPISFTATRDATNAATHATAMLTIALVQARDAGIVPATLRVEVDQAITRAVTWLNRGPQDGAEWSDYPNNERRVENILFSAMAVVASYLGGERDGRAASAFRRAASTLPDLTDSFPSNSYVELANGDRFIDQYRHPTSPWIGAAAAMSYQGGAIGERRRLRAILRAWIAGDVGHESLLRQDWMTGETLYLRSIAFPVLTRGENRS
ncbi:MAG TPA: toll/interleukin-1 receptor domain-containing protein [Allosphingosinicella sp.]|nr:toll/interleukin-1 receptor domain-containing protein [Allosphingosinicella sp.]